MVGLIYICDLNVPLNISAFFITDVFPICQTSIQMTNEPSTVATVSIKFLPFWPVHPEFWFTPVEAQLTMRAHKPISSE